MPDFLVIPVFIIAVLIIFGLTFWARFKTVGPDEAMIVTGTFLGSKNVFADESGGRRVKIVRGGGAFILPIFQRAEFLTLLSHKLDVATPEVYTEQGVPVMANGVAIIKIGGSVEAIATAAEQFMGKSINDLKSEAQEVLEGHLRAILGTMSVEDIYKNRDKFAQSVQEVAAVDLRKMGLQIVSFTIKDVRDSNGYLEALGRPKIATVKRDADVAEAEAMRDARIKKARAEEESKKAELIRDTNIAEAEKEKELKVAAFKKDQDTAKAEADQAYFIQEAKSKQVTTEEQMKVDIVRKEKEIELQEKEITKSQKKYDAEIKKKSDAERYAVEQAAEAEKAKRIRLAEANAKEKELEGLAAATAKKAEGTADAEVIRIRGLAEAEAKEKIAEAFAKFGEAAILDIIVKMLPELGGKIAEPLNNIEKLTVVDTGNGKGAMQLSNYVTTLMATAPKMVEDVTGIDIEGLISGIKEKRTPKQKQFKEQSEGQSEEYTV